jgi:hypothetical protein
LIQMKPQLVIDIGIDVIAPEPQVASPHWR